MTAPIVYHRTRRELTSLAFSSPLVRYGDNERSAAEHGQLWQRVAEGKVNPALAFQFHKPRVITGSSDE